MAAVGGSFAPCSFHVKEILGSINDVNKMVALPFLKILTGVQTSHYDCSPPQNL